MLLNDEFHGPCGQDTIPGASILNGAFMDMRRQITRSPG
jgi:hypothetical protein